MAGYVAMQCPSLCVMLEQFIMCGCPELLVLFGRKKQQKMQERMARMWFGQTSHARSYCIQGCTSIRTGTVILDSSSFIWANLERNILEL
jgi:hypothetical protein